MNKTAVAALITGSLAAFSALAADYVWTGAGIGGANDQWQVPGNWEIDGVACESADSYPHASEDRAIFNKEARVLVAEDTTIGELVVNAPFNHVRDRFLKVGMLSGTSTLRLSNRARLDFVNAEPITVTVPIDASNSDNNIQMLVRGTGKTVTYAGNLSGNGSIQFEGDIKLSGDNSAFEGAFQIHSSSTVEFLSASAGSAKATWIYTGNNKKTSHINLDGTLYLGAFQQTSYGAVDFRVNLGKTTQKANVVIGGNGVDSVIMGSWGDANNNNDRPNSYSKITKVGDETLKVYCPWHRLGTEIAGGVLEVIGPNALTGRDSKDISPIAFTGGTLRYGIDTTTDSANPMSVTTDWSHLVKDSTAAISVDTGGNDVTWLNESLANNNPEATGFTKKGAGTLELAGTKRDGSWKLFSDETKTVTIEEGTLAIRNAKFNSRFTLGAKLLGKGALKILSEEARGGIWLQGTEAFADFEGTLDWANELAEKNDDGAYASGFMMSNSVNFEMPKGRMVVSGNPAEPTYVMKGETQWNPASAHVTVGAYVHPHPNAVVWVERSAWTLNILGTAGDSYLNGKFASDPVHVVKTGAAPLAIGPDFSAPEGSTIAVNEGVFEIRAGQTMASMPSYLTIADGVAFAGEGVFGAVDLAKNDVVAPALTPETADPAKTYPVLTAASFTGRSASLEALCATLNAGAKRGSWRQSVKKNADGTCTLVLAFRRTGLIVTLK